MSTSTFHVLLAASGSYFWELRDASGTPYATSGESYPDFGDALAGLYVFRGRAATSPVNDRTVPGAPARIAETEYEVVADPDGGVDWTFQQTTGEPIASGVAHPDKARVLASVERAQSEAGEAAVSVEADVPVDIEACAAGGHGVPQARQYRIRVDREGYVVDRPCLTGREVLATAGLSPAERYQLYQKDGDGQKRAIGLDETVDLTRPGVERFQTIEHAVIDGALGMARASAQAGRLGV